jgi:acetyl-CoA carboxylase carboxyltransferase component
MLNVSFIFLDKKIYYREREKCMLSDTKAGQALLRLFDGESREIGGAKSPVVCASGEIRGVSCFAFYQDADIDGGVMTRAHADKIIKTLKQAAQCGAPVIGIFDSKGADLREGAAAMTYYADILAATAEFSGVVPFFAVAAGVVSASSALIAGVADILITTEKSEVYLTPGQGNDDKKSLAAIEAHDLDEAFMTVSDLIEIFPQNNLGRLPDFEFETPTYQKDDIIRSTLDSDTPSFELYKNFGKASKTVLGTVGGQIAGIVSLEGKTICKDCRKLSRFVSLCDAYSIPVITFAGGSFSSEISAEAVLSLSKTYSQATTVKITAVSGGLHGAFGAVLLSGNADAVYAFPDSAISPLAPETAVEFFSHEKLKGATNLTEKRRELANAYAKNEAAPAAAADCGAIEAVIPRENFRSELTLLLDTLRTKRVHARPAKKHAV